MEGAQDPRETRLGVIHVLLQLNTSIQTAFPFVLYEFSSA